MKPGLGTIQPPLGRLLRHVQALLEALGAAVVRIGHVLAFPARARVEEQAELRLRGSRRHRAEDAQVAAIHCEDVVEFLEIALGDLAGPERAQVVSAALGVLHAARIRGLAYVIVVRAGRCDAHMICEAPALDQRAKDAFARGRTADVAGADDEDRDRHQLSPPTAMRRSRSIFSSSRRLAARSNSRFRAASSISRSSLRIFWSSCFSESAS